MTTTKTDAAGTESAAGPDAPASRVGRVRPMILLWALGVPIPLILIILAIRGCM
jgi:hypothetical protein